MPAANNPALIATAQQSRAAGSYMLGRRKDGPVDLDCLHDVANFMTRDGGHAYVASSTQVPRLQIERVGILNWYVGGTGVDGSNSFAIQLNATAPSFFADTLGNVGIGTGSPTHKLSVQSSSEIARFTTSTVRGSGNAYIGIADPSGRKAFIAYGGGNDDFYVFNEMAAGLVFGTNGTSRWGITAGGNFFPTTDNASSVGTSGARIAVGYAASNWIVTCDIRFKTYRAEPEPTIGEHAAVLECFEVFGFFQHVDSIERESEGGAPARWHFGPKAQAVWTIFANHDLAAPLGEDGLPPAGSVPPAFLCFDAWGEETAPEMAWWRPSDILGPDEQPIMVPCAEGEEGTEQRPTGETYVTREAGNIFGVRIDQLQSLMLVALNEERKALEARVAALELPE